MWPFRKNKDKLKSSTIFGNRASRPKYQNTYQWLEGRRHVADAPYLLPKDDEEIDRLDFQHYIIRAIVKGNYEAPIGQPTNILDVGCGTGRWGREMAQSFPQATIVGFDLVSPLETSKTPFPANCRFVQGNVLEGLPFTDRSFDFVHQRLLVFALPAIQWPGEVRELARVTRPGGWVELVEANITLVNMGPATSQLDEWITKVSNMRGIDPGMSRRGQELLEAAGLINVTAKQHAIPVGDWGGRIGKLSAPGALAVNRAMRQQVITQLGVSPEQYDHALAEAAQEYDRYHTSSSVYVSYGQRPA